MPTWDMNNSRGEEFDMSRGQGHCAGRHGHGHKHGGHGKGGCGRGAHSRGVQGRGGYGRHGCGQGYGWGMWCHTVPSCPGHYMPFWYCASPVVPYPGVCRGPRHYHEEVEINEKEVLIREAELLQEDLKTIETRLNAINERLKELGKADEED